MALVVTAACGGMSPSEDAAEGGAPVPAQTAAPLAYARDAEGAVTVVVGYATGGTVAVTASDGSTFTLAVPPFAVLEDTEITLTPLSEVRGLVAEPAPTWAVEMEPDGLEFLTPALLTITLARDVPLDEQLLFTADESGATAAPVEVRSTDPVLVIEHFSLAGATQFTPEQRALFRRKSAENAERRLRTALGERLQAERVAQLLTGEVTTDARAELDSIREEYQREVIDRLRQNAAGCLDLVAYVRAVTSFERVIQLTGLTADEERASNERVADALAGAQDRYEECEREAIARCRASQDPADLVRFWLSAGREAAAGMIDAARRICLGQDYRIEKVVAFSYPSATYSIRYTGTKCGGHEGVWEIDSEGTLSGGGGTATIGGPLTVRIGEGGTDGTLDAATSFRSEFDDWDGGFFGTATFVEDPPTLELVVTGTRGGGYPYGWLDTGLMEPGTVTLPLEAGRFCE